MKVILTHGYFLHDDPREQAIMKPYPPLGILYIADRLRREAIPTSVFDSTFSSMSDLKAHMEREKPDLIGIYANMMTKLKVLEIIRFVKENLAGCKVVLGGPDVTYNAEKYMQNGADFIIVGEGEETMTELVYALKKTDLSQVDGLIWKDESGEIRKNAARTKMKDMSGIGIPARDMIDMQRYLDVWKQHHGSNSITVSTQRGCPYTCKWCSTAVYGQSYRRRSPKDVLAELKQIMVEYQPDSIWFVDDVFTVSHKWIRELHAEIMAEGLKFSFECITRAERLNEEILQLMKEMGCRRIWIGAESGSQKILDAMDRKVEAGIVRQAILDAKAIGIETGTFIMLGYPGEDKKDIQETLAHLKACTPDLFTVTLAYPIKGTGLYEEVKDGVKFPDWESSTDRDIRIPRPYPDQYYHYAIRRMTNEVAWERLRQQGKGMSLAGMKLKLKAIIAGWLMNVAG